MHRIALVSLALYEIACALPALEFRDSRGQTDIMFGMRALAVGWSGIFAAVFAWYGNPFWFISLLCAFFNKPRASVVAALFALPIALSTLTLFGQQLPLNEGNTAKTAVVALLPGFYVWMASIASLPLFTLRSGVKLTPPFTSIRQIRFRDPRPPHEIKFAFEREWMTLLQPSSNVAQLTFHASAQINGAPYRTLLRLEAALPSVNCYLLEFEAEETLLAPAGPGQGSRPLDLWIDFFPPPQPGEGYPELARKLTQQALAAEANLTDVHALQQEILAALRRGATYAKAHKAGGTNISYQNGEFVRADHGESSRIDRTQDEAAFLSFLRNFYDRETSRSAYLQKISEYDAWKLILRLRNESQAPYPGPPLSSPLSPALSASS